MLVAPSWKRVCTQSLGENKDLWRCPATPNVLRVISTSVTMSTSDDSFRIMNFFLEHAICTSKSKVTLVYLSWAMMSSPRQGKGRIFRISHTSVGRKIEACSCPKHHEYLEDFYTHLNLHLPSIWIKPPIGSWAVHRSLEMRTLCTFAILHDIPFFSKGPIHGRLLAKWTMDYL